MKFDPNKELTDAEVEALGEEEFFEYIDTKAAYLKQFTRPLETYHTKRFVGVSAAMQGRSVTQQELDSAKRIGKENFQKRMEQEDIAAEQLGGDPKYRDPQIKHFKTHRSQWFD